MDAIRVNLRFTKFEADAFRERFQLTNQVLPFTNSQIVQVFALAQSPERRGRKLLLLLFDVIPKVQEAQKVAGWVGKPGVKLVGLQAFDNRPLARVLDREAGHDDHHFSGE